MKKTTVLGLFKRGAQVYTEDCPGRLQGNAAGDMIVTAAGGGALAVKGGDDVWAGLQTLWIDEIHDTVLDDVAAGAAKSLGDSETTATILQGVAGAVGTPANILKEGGEELAEEGTERVT